MSVNTRCPTCEQFVWSFETHHECPPEWDVRDSDDSDDDWGVVREIDEAAAAEKFADSCDSDAGEGPRERKVLVRAKGSAEVKRFEITFEHAINYSAAEE